MKCPNCGKWNKAGLPHCMTCGTPLESSPQGNNPAWMADLNDKAKKFISVDDEGNVEQAYDKRDLLAGRMADLQIRKEEGRRKMSAVLQRDPRTVESAREPIVTTGKNQESFFSQPLPESKPSSPPPPPRPAAPSGISPYSINAPYETDSILGIHDRPELQMNEQSSYDYMKSQEMQFYDSRRYDKPSTKKRSTRRRGLIKILLIVLCTALATAAVMKFVVPLLKGGQEEISNATVVATIRNDLAAHTVSIPGEEGQRITIREIRSSSIVTGGTATFDIPDHIWYEGNDPSLGDSMEVTLTPYLTLDNGRQKALPKIHYEILIPLSPIELDTPDNLYKKVATSLFSIVFYVREGSTVTINGENYSDLVNTGGGKVTYNATVQPIGSNEYHIVVRSQYCRENSVTITLYREKQEIPLDLATDVTTSSDADYGNVTIKGTTLPGAVVKVLSPHMDLDITNTSTDGSFSFVTRFDHYGDNTVIITAEYPGKATTRVEHVVYWVPNINIYSRKAWDIVTQYTDLMDNIDLRKKASQIYVCKGIVTSIDTTKPQRAFMNIGTEESPVYIYLENRTKTTWTEGTYYRIYADATGTYNSKPWLIARYTYTK